MKKTNLGQRLRNAVLVIGTISISLIVTYSIYTVVFSGKIYRGVKIVNTEVSGLTPADSKLKLIQHITIPTNITLNHQNQVFAIPLSSINFSYDFDSTVDSAFRFGRSGNVAMDVKSIIASPFMKPNYSLKFSLDPEKLTKHLSTIAEQITTEPVKPSVDLASNGKILVNKGKVGSKINQLELTAEIQNNFSTNNFSPIIISIYEIDSTIDDNQALLLEKRAQKLVGKKSTLTYAGFKLEVTDKEMINSLTIDGFDTAKLAARLSEVSIALDSEPRNPVFVEDEGKVKEFNPSKEGVSVQKEKLLTDAIDAFIKLENTDDKVITIDIPVKITEPPLKTGQINNLGIKELIGVGKSTFKGSIPGRVHNVDLAASRLSGVLIKPGEIFSFNAALGDVSKYTGYKSAYVIKDGKTILGDGGGVCQVSTTLFRAALDAGLTIIERHAHSYRVYYYEQDSGPGLDATVYAPTTDLKIQNDTPGHILIQAFADTKNLTLRFELYGTSDNRVATVTKPIIVSSVAPAEDVYQDDPTLPAGTIKQVEHKAWGAKVVFKYTVAKDGQEALSKDFVSNYRPWQAVYLRGTAPTQ